MAILTKVESAETVLPEALGETDRVTLYAAAKVRQFGKGENILAGVERSDSFYWIISGALEVFGVSDAPFGTPLTFNESGMIGPIAPGEGVKFWIRVLEMSTVLEIMPGALATLPGPLQLWVYRSALRSYDRSTRFLRASNRALDRKNRLLAERWKEESERAREASSGALVQNFLTAMPKLPSYATELLGKLMDVNGSMQGIAETIKQDPALAAIVLRRVNSARYGFSKRIESYYHACIIMGTSSLHQVVLEEAINTAVRLTAETHAIQVHSCLISAICYEVAQLSGEVQPQTATTIGLLHDIGRSALVLLLERHPEMKAFGKLLDTAKIGAELARHWGLPQRICESIEFQDQAAFMPPDAIESDYRKEIAALHLAHLFEGELSGNPLPPSQAPFINEYLETLKIPASDFAEICTTKIKPALARNWRKLPPEVRKLFPGIRGQEETLPASSSAPAARTTVPEAPPSRRFNWGFKRS